MLAGLKDRIMTPEAAEEAMRAYAEETNRLNRARRTAGVAQRAELEKVERAMKEIVEAIEIRGYTRMLTERLRELEVRQDTLKERMATAPERNVAHIYRRKVARLAEALNHPEDGCKRRKP